MTGSMTMNRSGLRTMDWYTYTFREDRADLMIKTARSEF
jgi:hypothetical protein